jgi:hypothetical protein
MPCYVMPAGKKSLLITISVSLFSFQLVSSFLREVPSLENMKNYPSLRSEISKLACEVKNAVLERVRSDKRRIGYDNLPSSSTFNSNNQRQSDGVLNDTTAAAVGSEGEGAISLSAEESSGTNTDVIPSENSASIYVIFFYEILHRKIKDHADAAYSSNDNSVANTSPAPNTSIRDNILDLLQRHCESFPA